MIPKVVMLKLKYGTINPIIDRARIDMKYVYFILPLITNAAVSEKNPTKEPTVEPYTFAHKTVAIMHSSTPVTYNSGTYLIYIIDKEPINERSPTKNISFNFMLA